MLSIEIYRNYRNLTVTQLCRLADIKRPTYYNILSGFYCTDPATIKKFDLALQLNGFLQFAYLFDRLFHAGIKLAPDKIFFPENFPADVTALFYQHHPVFNNNCTNKFNNKNHKRK